MNQYVGLDVSLEETKIHVLDEAGGRVWRGKCASHPDELETAICKHAPGALRIGLETGPLTTWLWTELSKRRLPMVCLDARAAHTISHGRYVAFQMAEVAIPRNLFADILRLIAELRPPPATSTA